MRVILVGAPGDRERLRSRLGTGSIDIVAERLTIAEARSGDIGADAFLVPATSSVGRPSAEPLTPRESEILQLLSQGLLSKEIARQLSISIETVNSHLKHIYGKLHVRTRTEAVIKFLK